MNAAKNGYEYVDLDGCVEILLRTRNQAQIEKLQCPSHLLAPTMDHAKPKIPMLIGLSSLVGELASVSRVRHTDISDMI